MTNGELLAATSIVVNLAVGTLTWLRRSTAESTLTTQRLAELKEKHGEIERRLDKAGVKTSSLASEVQGLPERCRQAVKQDQAELWTEVRHLRGVVEKLMGHA